MSPAVASTAKSSCTEPDRHAVGIEHDAVVAGLGDGAAAGQRGQPGAAPGPQAAVDGVVVQVGAAAAPPGLDAPAGQCHHVVEVLARQLGVGRGCGGPAPTGPRRRAPRWRPPRPPAAGPARRAGRPAARAGRAGPRARRPAGRCTRPARRGSSGRAGRPACRRGGGWPGRRAGGRCRWPGASRSGRPARPGRRRCPARARRWPPARAGHRRAAASRRCAAGPPRGCRGARPRAARRRRRRRRRPGARRSPARRSASWWATRSAILRVLTKISVVRWCRGVLGDAVEDVGHLTAAHHRLELGGGQLDRHIEIAGVAAVDDHGRRAVVVHAREQAGHHVERALGGREADALEAAAALGDQRVQPLEAQGEVAAPLVAGQRVHLVDDDGAHAAQHGPRRRRGEEEVERLGRGHQQVGRRACAWRRARPAGCRRCAWRRAARGRRSPGGPPPPGSRASGTCRFSCTSTARARSGEM